MNQPDIICVGGIFIDDIVYPDGRTDMEILGGGVIHAAAGVSVWEERPGLFAIHGTNFPGALWQRIITDFDTQGLINLNIPQMRAWQLFEWNGKRTELHRVDIIEPFLTLPDINLLPEAYQQAKIFFLLSHADVLQTWRNKIPDQVIFWEPTQHLMHAEYAEEFRAAIPIPDIISPNLLEASNIYGFDNPDTLVDAMLEDGARIIALRMGEAGSLVATKDERHHIPAMPVAQIIDQTGAGNTYCGGFMVGYMRTGNIKQAGIYGAIAASFNLEHVGVLQLTEEIYETRAERLNYFKDS